MKRYGCVVRIGQVSGRVLRRLATNSTVFHYARIPAYWGTFGRVRTALDLRHGESLLDLGCGTGFGTALARGLYAGISRRYRIAAEETFHNTLRIVSQVLFTLVPLADLPHPEHAASSDDARVRK